jgi:hypothetical protein
MSRKRDATEDRLISETLAEWEAAREAYNAAANEYYAADAKKNDAESRRQHAQQAWQNLPRTIAAMRGADVGLIRVASLGGLS